MIKIVIGGFYLLGMVFAFGRMTGAFWAIEELALEYNADRFVKPWWKRKDLLWIGLSMIAASWLGLGIMATSYYQMAEDKYFFKWNYKELRKREMEKILKELVDECG